MSFGRKPNLREPLFTSNRSEVEVLSEKITENIEGFNEYIQALEEFDNRLGTKEDNRGMREQMKEEITEANDVMKKTTDLFRHFDDLSLKNKDDIDYRNKVVKRARDSFNKQNDKFTKVLKSIQKKEKLYLQVKKTNSAMQQKNNVSAYAPIGDDFIASEIAADLHDLDFTENVIKERQEDVHEIRRLAHEMNLTAQYQARKIYESGKDIELVEENTKDTVIQVTSANKNLDQCYKFSNSLILCGVVGLTCLLVIVIIGSNHGLF